MSKPSLGVSLRTGGQDRWDSRVKGLAETGFGLAQPRLDLRPARVDRRQVWRGGRHIPPPSPAAGDTVRDADRVVGPQRLQHHASTGGLRRAQHTELLSHGAEAYGCRGEFWMCTRVATVIWEELGASYHKAHVSRLMKRLAWTPQLPIERAAQRDEAVIKQWRVQVWLEPKNSRV
jgi:Winged helix-turn helix